MSGYSETPLARKLGIRPGQRVRTRNAPVHYAALLLPLPAGVAVSPRLRAPVDMWHFFTRSRDELAEWLPRMQAGIPADGTIWVSWPKRPAGVQTDMTEDAVRAIALPLGLVDVKVCAVDETWSGLKLVIRKERRAAHPRPGR